MLNRKDGNSCNPLITKHLNSANPFFKQCQQKEKNDK